MALDNKDPLRLSNDLRTKLYEGLRAHCAGMGLPMVGGGFEQAVLDRAGGELGNLTSAQISSMSLASERLVAAIAGSVNTVISQLSAPQQMALRAGLDPFSPAVILAANTPGGLARLIAGKTTERIDGRAEKSRSGRRFSELRGDESRAEGRAGFEDTAFDPSGLSGIKSTGLSRGVFKELIQRFTLNQLRHAGVFANELGVSADAYAGKFAGLDKDSRSDLREFVGEMRDDPALSDDDKRKQIAVFQAAHPKLKGKLSEADMLGIINATQRDARADVGDDTKRSMSTQDMRDQASSASLDSTGKQAKAAAQRSSTSNSDDDLLAALDGAAGQQASAKQAQRPAIKTGVAGRQPNV